MDKIHEVDESTTTAANWTALTVICDSLCRHLQPRESCLNWVSQGFRNSHHVNSGALEYVKTDEDYCPRWTSKLIIKQSA